MTWHNQFLPDTDRELAKIAPAFSKCSRSAILIIDEMSDGSDRNKKGGTLGGLNNSRICAENGAFMGKPAIFRKPCDFSMTGRLHIIIRKASTSPGADWCE